MRTLQPNTAVHPSDKNSRALSCYWIVGPGFQEPPFFNFDGAIVKVVKAR